ncbi:MAG: DUF4430 domain-containing protein [Emergencia sp.]
MEKQKKNELAAGMKNKRRRKYLLAALAIFIIATTVVGLSIESRDAKLPDGQGNLIAEQTDDTQNQADDQAKDQTKETGQKDDQNTDQDKTAAEDSTSGSKANQTDSTKNPAKQNLANLSDKEKENIKPSDIAVDNSEDFTASNGGNSVLKPDKPKPVTVTLEIRCDTLSSDMSKLENPAIEKYIPKDGIILTKSTYKGTTENTVFDALNTLCRNNDIQLDFDYTPVYESYYIKGINYLYEFDGGNLSGWMYKVNDWFPNYGCSSYYLSDGDVIQWVYTCDLGKDVGDNSMQ